LSPAQVAEALGVNEKTVRNWVEAGVVEAQRTPAGRYRLPAAVVPTLKQLADQGVPLNARELRTHLPQRTTPKSQLVKRETEEDR
jgi:excisionase family DNA binding protein